MSFPGKTGLRKANSDEKNKRLAAFDRLMKQIASEPALSSSPAFKAFLTGVCNSFVCASHLEGKA